MIRVPCPKCRKVLRASPERVGTRARCPACGERIVVPDADATAAAFGIAGETTAVSTGPNSMTADNPGGDHLAVLREALNEGRIDRRLYEKLRADWLEAVPPRPVARPVAVPRAEVTGTLELPAAGGWAENGGALEVFLDGQTVGRGTRQEGFRLRFGATVGRHTVRVRGVSAAPVTAFVKSLVGTGERVFPVEFPAAGGYTVTFGYTTWARLTRSHDAADVPTEVRVDRCGKG